MDVVAVIFSCFVISHFMYRVCTGFGKLWKLTSQFSRTWKVLGKERLYQNGFFKMALKEFWIFAWGNSKIS